MQFLLPCLSSQEPKGQAIHYTISKAKLLQFIILPIPNMELITSELLVCKCINIRKIVTRIKSCSYSFLFVYIDDVTVSEPEDIWAKATPTQASVS